MRRILVDPAVRRQRPKHGGADRKLTLQDADGICLQPEVNVVSLDDVRFGNISAVPELSTWAMIMFGFAGVGFMGYRRSRKQCDLLALRAA